MKEDFIRIEEFHCSSRVLNSICHANQSDDPIAIKPKFSEQEEKKFVIQQQRNIYQRNSTAYVSSSKINHSVIHISPNKTTKYRHFEEATCCSNPFIFNGTDNSKAESKQKKNKKDKEKKQNGVLINLVPAQHAEENSKNQAKSAENLEVEDERLKEKLSDSLSPSPFRNETAGEQEEKLEQLVASSAQITKGILSSPFYGSEMAPGGSLSVGRKL